MTIKRRLWGLLGGAALTVSGVAHAQTTTPLCNDPEVLPNPVYLTGSSAAEPMLQAFSVAIQAANQGKPASDQLTMVYLSSKSCDGISAILLGSSLTSGGSYYVADATVSGGISKKQCRMDNAGVPLNIKADIGISDVPYNLCPGAATLPTTIGNWVGPTQSMLIVVPKGNATTTSISAEQAAAIWGCGANGGVAPYVDENAIQQRDVTSGTQILVARAIGVPASSFKGVGNSGTTNLINGLLAVADPMKAIGFVAADAYQSAINVGKMNALAFRAFWQTKAYYADSSATAVDKRNVRDGHYAIQSPLNFFAALANGQPAPLVKKLLDYLTGAAPLNPAKPNEYIDIVAGAGNVPDCAMKVKVSGDSSGYFSPYKPAASCGCYFESVVTQTSPAGCVPCTTSATCTGGTTCQTGFCEQ